MYGLAGLVFSLVVLLKANLPVHVQAMVGCTGLHKGPGGFRDKTSGEEQKPPKNRQQKQCGDTGTSDSPVEEVPVVRDKDVGLRLMDVFKPPLNERGLDKKENSHQTKPAILTTAFGQLLPQRRTQVP